jgi:glyoxylase-like metal-dependent hydrolase (beta-lactamase superfamily II)
MPSEQIRPIDVQHLGRSQVISSWLVGDVLVDPGPASSVTALLEGLDGTIPRAIALTHIHLDHAGATGTLVQRWPGVQVWVHERGMRHLVDPTRLMESVTRIYGDHTQALWGEVLPVPSANIVALQGGEQLAPFEVAYTPGHAWHHVSYWHPATRTAFVGDVAGVRIEPLDYVLPPTPPPDIDLEAWHESIARVRSWQPERLAITHFGWVGDPQSHLSLLESQLGRWSLHARDVDRDQFVRDLRADIDERAGAEGAARYAQGAPYEHIYDGLARYWSKRGEASRALV